MTLVAIALLAIEMPTLAFGETSVGAAGQQFVHPGLLHSDSDLARIRAKVECEEEPWFAGFRRLASQPSASSDWKSQGPFAHVRRDPAGSLHDLEMRSDGNAAYHNALMWCITGKKSHARKAVEILDAWSSMLRSMDGHDVQLAAGLNGFKFVNAAELMRATYPEWSRSEIEQCQRMFLNVIYPPTRDLAKFANGNWDGACMKTMMGIGVFCDDRKIFDRAVSYYYNGSGNGRITHYIVNDQGQSQESGRDQSHAQLGLGNLAEACEIGWHQGRDMYGAADNRLLKGFEYTAKYLLGEDVPFSRHTDSTGKYTATRISCQDRKSIRPNYEMVWNHYEHRRRIDAPFTRRLADRIRPEGPAYGADHPGFGTLLFSLPSIVP